MAIKIEVFNDLNKLVKTVHMVDKLLTEKPKRTRIKTTSVSLTQKEIDYLVEHLSSLKNFEVDEDDIPAIRSIINKLK
jgi:hypothetical protein